MINHRIDNYSYCTRCIGPTKLQHRHKSDAKNVGTSQIPRG